MGVIVQNIIKCYFSFFFTAGSRPAAPAGEQLARESTLLENYNFEIDTEIKTLYTVHTWQSCNLHRYEVAK